MLSDFRFRDYTNDFRFDANNYVAGIEIRPDSGGRIINYPEQHIKNGIEKNLKTNYQFKRCVRVMKNIRPRCSSSRPTPCPC